ncbi:MAG: hypothetical protein ABIH66_00175 [bacterium]
MRLFLPSFLCVALLFAHSYVFRGKKITFSFFGWCYLIKALKALADSNPEQRDYFPLDSVFGLTHNGIPYDTYLLVLPIGWIFAHYVSWCIAEAILRQNPKKRNAYFPIVILSIIGTTLVGLCMEYVNNGVGWWRWEAHIQQNAFQYMAVWATWSIMFFYFFFMFHIKGPDPRRLRIGAYAYIILFFASVGIYANVAPGLMQFVYVMMFIAQVPLYFFNSVKLKPMLKEDIEPPRVKQ